MAGTHFSVVQSDGAGYRGCDEQDYMEPPSALGHRPWSTRAATACPVQVWGWPLGCPWSARRRRARGQGACCFRVASSRRCDDECSSALAVRDGRGSSQRHQSQARTVRALRRPASQLSPGITETSLRSGTHPAGRRPNHSKKVCRACNQTAKFANGAAPARRRRGERLDIALTTNSRFLRRDGTPRAAKAHRQAALQTA